ncbi:hypothetical protein [Mycobacterium tilburgii]|uniref:hypothetical protein n=1 Tax=Mycobacterium tilburgii TaxID=44467 RepID=UPI0021B17FDD|nr:hypothetical protein [Mycobacterium tilburgii]
MQQAQANADAERQIRQAKAEERAQMHAAAVEATEAAAEHHSEVQVAANEKLAAERLRRNPNPTAEHRGRLG